MEEEHHILGKGYRLEEYEVIKTLGVGGFGITYLGRDLNLDKEIAIKEYFPNEFAVRQKGSTVLPRSQGNRGDFDWGLTRFLDEARVLAKFSHPNIVRVSRYFKSNSTAYIVMEYVDGEPLSDFLKREAPLNEQELRAIITPIMEGLDQVHATDFLHRDIKPDNIMLRPDGSPVLLDFGAARIATGGKSRRLTAILTPGYAPIEQYSESSTQGPYTDIYALAAICYEAITTETPQVASDRVLDDKMPKLSESHLQGWSPAFLQAIDAALQLRPNNRPADLEAWFEIMEQDEADGSAPNYQPDAATAAPTETVVPGSAYAPAAGAEMGSSSNYAPAPDIDAPSQSQVQTAAPDYYPEEQETFSDAALLDMPLGFITGEISPLKAETAAAADEMFETALANLEGRGVPEDAGVALAWFEKAAYLGHAESQYNLGRLYSVGIGVQRDDHAGARWYRHAAMQDHAEAQTSLAIMLIQRGQPHDAGEARGLLTRAAEQGDELATGILDEMGDGTPVETTAEPTPEPNGSPTIKPEGGYLVRHWRGQLSLAVSYWVNGTLFGLMLNFGFEAMGILKSPGTEAVGRPWPDYLATSVIILWLIWFAIGTIRSANAHIEYTGDQFWARVAQVICVLHLGMALLAMVIVTGILG